MRIYSTSLLYPPFRERILALMERLGHERIPLAPYETARTPKRQAELFSRGRSPLLPGTRIVTRARAWESRHQYGLAVDFVFRAGDKWTWEEPIKGQWERYHVLAKGLGLDVLSFERPHVQYPWSLQDLRAGIMPAGGQGGEWAAWVDAQAESWGTEGRFIHRMAHPGAPSALLELDERPEMAEDKA